MPWKILLVALGTLFALVIATNVFFPRHGADAVDIALVWHSPLYWVVVVAIFVIAGWLLKLWLHAAKP